MSSRAVSLAKRLVGKENVLPIPRLFVQACGDYETAALLTQVMYWSDKGQDGEFYKTDEEFGKELELSPYQLNRARKKLVEFGVTTKRKGIPATTFYELDTDKLENKLLSFLVTSNQVSSGTSYEVSSQLIQKTTALDYATEEPPNGLSLSQAEPKAQTIATARQSSNGDWYMATYNELRPPAWKSCETINAHRAKKLKAFRGEYKDRAPEIFKAAMIFAQRDPWWSGKNLAFDTLFNKNNITQFAEGAITALQTGVDPAQSDFERRRRQITEALA